MRVRARRKNELEEAMLMNLQKKTWMAGLKVRSFEEHQKENAAVVKELRDLAER